jgi:hypothetical protein
LFNFHIFLSFPIFLLFFFLFTVVIRKDNSHNFNLLKVIKTHFAMKDNLWHIRRIFVLFLYGRFCIGLVVHLVIILFESVISLFICSLDNLSIVEDGTLMSPTLLVFYLLFLVALLMFALCV